MTKKLRQKILTAFSFLCAFVVWTILVCTVDVQPIGLRGTSVGFATMNGWIHRKIGVNMMLYYFTDILSILPLSLVAGFAVLGLTQWIRRNSLWKVDGSILLLGCFYLVVFAVYILFETVFINYRPVLIQGNPESSYPSSTTMLSICVMSTAILQLRQRIRHRMLKRFICLNLSAVSAFLVIGRVFSGVHWFSDIIGGALLSTGLVMLYHALWQHLQMRDYLDNEPTK